MDQSAALVASMQLQQAADTHHPMRLPHLAHGRAAALHHRLLLPVPGTTFQIVVVMSLNELGGHVLQYLAISLPARPAPLQGSYSMHQLPQQSSNQCLWNPAGPLPARLLTSVRLGSVHKVTPRAMGWLIALIPCTVRIVNSPFEQWGAHTNEQDSPA